MEVIFSLVAPSCLPVPQCHSATVPRVPRNNSVSVSVLVSACRRWCRRVGVGVGVLVLIVGVVVGVGVGVDGDVGVGIGL